MTYKVNGVQYWRRKGVCCSWTKEEGRKVISEEMYLDIVKGTKGNNKEPEVLDVKVIDPKSKIEIRYQEIDKRGKIVNKKKVIMSENLAKVSSNMEAKDNFVKIIEIKSL